MLANYYVWLKLSILLRKYLVVYSFRYTFVV